LTALLLTEAAEAEIMALWKCNLETWSKNSPPIKIGMPAVTVPKIIANHASPFIAPNLLWRVLLHPILINVPRIGRKKERRNETMNSHLFPTSETTVIPSALFLATTCSYCHKWYQNLLHEEANKMIAIKRVTPATIQPAG